MIKSYEMGYEIVIAQRTKDNHIGWVKRVTSNFFYKIINRVSGTYMVPGAADFRMMSRQVVNILNQMQERKRYLRGLVGWVGFKSTIISYKQPQRIAGKPKYSFWSSARLAEHALLSFSKFPLQLSFIIGAGMLGVALLQVIWVLYLFMIGKTNLVPGWASLMMFILLGNGTTLIMLGIQGYYIGMLIDEAKKRPMYILHYKYSQKDKS
jgi:dolichol-phosphate mannosyltransferase